MISAPRVAALVGPTGSGKTALAVALHVQHGLPIEVVSVDAVQVYRRLDAGTAKPTLAERQAVPTWLIDVADPVQPWNTARHMAEAMAVIAAITARGHWPLLVGGAGLYVRSLVRGLAEIPEVPQAVRVQLAQAWQLQGPGPMHEQLQRLDPAYAAKTPAQNRQRVLRALEVIVATGIPFSQYHQAHAQQPDRLDALTLVLDPPRAAFAPILAARAAAMAGPILHEVKQLLDGGLPADAPALQALGYRDAVEVLGQGLPLQLLQERLVRSHSAYVKRQRTWFAKCDADLQLSAVNPDQLAVLATTLREFFEQGRRPPRSPQQPVPQG